MPPTATHTSIEHLNFVATDNELDGQAFPIVGNNLVAPKRID